MCLVNKTDIRVCFYILGHLLKESKALPIMKGQPKTRQKEQPSPHSSVAVNYLFSPVVA